MGENPDALLRVSIKSGELMVPDEGFHPAGAESGSQRRLFEGYSHKLLCHVSITESSPNLTVVLKCSGG